MRRTLTAVTAALMGASFALQAQDDAGNSRGVARISVINGEVSLRRGDGGDLIAAAINAPLVVQDRLLTGPSSRAEVQFDYSNMIRVSSNGEVRMAELEYKRYIVQVAKGMITFRVLRDQDADVEISTPNISIRPVKRGIYRVTVQEDGSSEVTVRSGEAEIYTPRGSERLKSGRTMLARGTAADPEFLTENEIRDDEWDRWNELRDRDLQRSRSYAYVSRDIYGAEDLDGQGRWISTPEYGYVWAPSVAPGWAPYRYGRWSWVDWYGWTWVSYDPWGWAPYHYGRWYQHARWGWCWYPGGISTRHYWSPALVAFLGFGRGVGVGVGFGNIGWVPLGPREPFYRWWGSGYYGGYRGGGYVNNNIRIVNNINIRNVYRNARVDNAITVIGRDGFRGGRGGNGLRVTDATFRDGGVIQGQLPVVPGRESLRVADRDSRIAQSPGRGSERFFSHLTPAAVDRIPFEQQRRGVEQLARRSFDEGSRGAPAGGRAPGRGTQDGSRGWTQGGATPAAGAQSFDSAPGRGAAENGWRRFGSARTAAGGGEADGTGRFGESPAARGTERQGGRGTEAVRGERQVGATPATGAQSFDSATGRGAAEDGWRRFGSARTSGGREATVRSERLGESPAARGTEGQRGLAPTGQMASDAEGWQRFGSSRGAAPAGGERGRSDRGDSMRSGSGARLDDSGPSRGEVAPRSGVSRGDSGGGIRGAGRSNFDSMPRSERGGDSVRISPPIVRERGGDGGSRGSGSMDGGGGGRGGDSGGARGGGGSGGRGGRSR